MINEREFELITDGVRLVGDALMADGHEVRIIGGAVRDFFLGRKPKDIDLATNAKPDQIVRALDKAQIGHKAIGAKFGIITAKTNEGAIEVATLRTDKECDGRHAKVDFTDNWVEDAARRDFTINAMSIDMNTLKVYDYYDGRADIVENRVRFIGDAEQRIKEDYLRILRYFRFLLRLPNSCETCWDTLEVIQKFSYCLGTISGERIWMEMRQILAHPNRDRVLKLMESTDVLHHIQMDSYRPLLTDTNSTNPAAVLGMVCVNFDVLREIREEWGISNKDFEIAYFVMKNRDIGYNEDAIKDMLVEGVNPEYVFAMTEVVNRPDLTALKEWPVPKFPVSGKDLIEMGMEPGPVMGAYA